MSLGQREYARHRKASGLAGGTHKAVQSAIKSGRLSKSLTKDRKRILSAAAADREWAATTYADRIPLFGPTSAGMRPPELEESRARREAAEASLSEIELGEKRTQLIPAEDVESRLVNVFARCRTKLLGISALARQRDASLTGTQLKLLSSLIEEAIEALSLEAAQELARRAEERT